MECKTTYNIGDKVWMMDLDKAYEGVICSMYISIIKSTIYSEGNVLSEKYCVNLSNGRKVDVSCDKLFLTKDDLLSHL